MTLIILEILFWLAQELIVKQLGYDCNHICNTGNKIRLSKPATMKNTWIYMGCAAALFTLFGFYNTAVYLGDTSAEPFTPKARLGQKIWQDNNCFSCHQLYGLGGYLGPDLTNLYSAKGKDYIKAFVNSGVKTMPRFSFTEQEKEALAAFLREVDQSGFYPDYKAKIKANGWVEITKK